MNVGSEYRDFRAFIITDESEHQELDVEMDKVKDLFNSESVYLLVRYDLRRIYIWKGPRSPVRKRFISSRIATKFQEKASQTGRHLKVVSVDAGDELNEFLNAFNVESYQVSAEERPEDMYYLRNEERRKLEEASLLATRDSGEKKEEEAYWSPALGEQNRQEQMEEAKKKAVSTAREIASSLEHPELKKKAKPISQHQPRQSRYTPFNKSSMGLSEGEEKAVLDLILGQDLPDGMNRINIITGTSLYGPKRVISSLFGKEVEETEWAKVTSIPDGKIDIDTNLIRVYCRDNEIEGVEILGKSNKKEEKRSLKKIPAGE
jgi:hypothetical protein